MLTTLVKRTIKKAMRTLLLIAVMIAASSQLAYAQASQTPTDTSAPTRDRLHRFTTDGCSSFPDGTLDEPTLWQHCCVMHDVKYWMGGTAQEKSVADRELGQCVAATGQDVTAFAMATGVGLFGTATLPMSWRWGYGWKFKRGYKALTQNERAQVDALFPKNPLSVPIEKPAHIIEQSFGAR